MQNKMFQPGTILHEVIVGALRANGSNFDAWCAENKVNRTTARLATFGQSGGPRGKQLLEKMIADAGPEVVEAAYRERMKAEAKKLEGAAA